MVKIAVLGNKGGTGKTFISVHIAWALADKGKRVFFLDTDYAQASGMKWLFGQKFEGECGRVYNVNNISACFVNIKKSKDNVLKYVRGLQNKCDFLVIDGRPEPEVTFSVLHILEGVDNIIIFPCVGWDSVTQTMDVVSAINAKGLKVRMYGWLNQSEQARASARIAEYFAKLTVQPFGIALSNSVTVKASEIESKPVWKIKGCGRTKFGIVFDTIANSLIMGRL